MFLLVAVVIICLLSVLKWDKWNFIKRWLSSLIFNYYKLFYMGCHFNDLYKIGTSHIFCIYNFDFNYIKFFSLLWSNRIQKFLSDSELSELMLTQKQNWTSSFLFIYWWNFPINLVHHLIILSLYNRNM